MKRAEKQQVNSGESQSRQCVSFFLPSSKQRFSFSTLSNTASHLQLLPIPPMPCAVQHTKRCLLRHTLSLLSLSNVIWCRTQNLQAAKQDDHVGEVDGASTGWGDKFTNSLCLQSTRKQSKTKLIHKEGRLVQTVQQKNNQSQKSTIPPSSPGTN